MDANEHGWGSHSRRFLSQSHRGTEESSVNLRALCERNLRLLSWVLIHSVAAPPRCEMSASFLPEADASSSRPCLKTYCPIHRVGKR